jgi:hypothetical protein
VYLAALVAVSLVSRLPQLLSPNLLADGDECILGLMAKHALDGTEVPIFFWGQRYGLSTVEAGAAAIAFALSHVGALPLKIAMLILWTAGVLFLYLALAKPLGARRSFWITVVFVLTPAWAVWSMKARGGYLTSFTSAAALLWLIVQDRDRHTTARGLAAGALTAVVYLAQPLWLAGVLPILAAVMLSRPRLRWIAAFVTAAAGVIALAQLATVSVVDIWPAPEIGNPHLIASLPGAVQQIYVNLTGAYYLASPRDPPGASTRILAWGWCGVLAAAALVQLYRLIAKRYHLPSHLLFLSVCATLGAALTLFARDGRYLLPLSGFLVALAGVELVDAVDRGLLSSRMAILITMLLLVLGAQSMREFREFNYLWTNPPNRWTEAQRLQEVINYLARRDVRRVFSMNGLLAHQLVFYSDETVIARGADMPFRYPTYVRKADRALDAEMSVAVVGYTEGSGAPGCWDVPICTGGIDRLVPDPGSIFTVDGKYFVYVGANRGLLTKLGFRFLN